MAAESKKEWVVISIWFDEKDQTCKVRERTPGEIRTDGGGRVTWIIDGECRGDHTIAINRRLRRDGTGHDLFAGSAPIQTKATDLARMSGTLKPGGEITKGHYHYEILIDGQPAQYNSRANFGDFFACPTWPCGEFQFDYMYGGDY